MASRSSQNWFESFEKTPEQLTEQQIHEKGDFFGEAIDTREIIKPELDRLDKEDLWNYVKKRIDKEKPGAFTEDVIPKFMVYDIYNKHFAQKKDMKIAKPGAGNKWLYDFLVDKMHTFYTKPITEENMMNSAIFTTEIVNALVEFNKEQNPDGDQGGGTGNSQIQKALSSGNGSGNLQQKMEQAQQKAQEKIEQMQNIKDEVVPDQEGENEDSEGGNSAGSGTNLTINDAEQLQEYYDRLRDVNFNQSTMANFFKDTLKMSTTYFSGKYKEEEESIFDADEIDDLAGFENLLPQLKGIGLEDVVTHVRKYHLKFDVYMDHSGSMGGGPNSKLMLAKVTGLKLNKLNLVADFYAFDTRITDKLSGMDFLRVRSRGGTSLELVVQQIQRLGRPAVVLTDACDTVSTYDPNAYFIGVTGANFGYFANGNDAKEYFTQGQCVLMNQDGTLHKVRK